MDTFLKGQIERVTYTNEENGFTVARLRVNKRKELVTVVGNLMAPSPGEIIEIKGEWTRHPRFGHQFKVYQYKTLMPASVYGIEKYLGSGLIKGIGPVMAGRIVRRFGKKSLDTIERHTDRLAEVQGIGNRRIGMIKKAWEDQKEIRGVMIFLQSHGVSTGYATKIFKQYGRSAIKVVKENPYRIATDIFGIGFLTADRIAEKLGFSKESQVRAEAGVLYVLQKLAGEGHVFYPYEPLIKACRDTLDVEREIITHAIDSIEKAGMILIEGLNGDQEENGRGEKAVYLSKFYVSESGIAKNIKKLTAAPNSIRSIDPVKALDWVQARLSITLADKQKEAVRRAVKEKVLIITGGPGTGKTTIINAILKIFARAGAKVMLAAPTGRAAKRMSETTGHRARTIHRMLEYSMQKGGFQKNEKRPLACDLLIVDEASMMDTILMHHLLKALPGGATFILVGDANQLPSVGAGNVLKDMILSNKIYVVELNKIFRQASESMIIVNAHRINNGLFPSFKLSGKGRRDFFFIEEEDPERVLKSLVGLVSERLPRRFGFSPVNDIQVITPMHKGVVGVANLNSELQTAVNPVENGLQRGDQTFRLHDKVMQVKNNYDKDVFNGDIGRITGIKQEYREVTISFDGRETVYDYTDLDEIELAYAVSVHKSQGSEFPAVVMPIVTQHYMLLQRNLIYTAVTRAKKLMVLVGTKKALAIGVKNDKTQRRFTGLWKRLKG